MAQDHLAIGRFATEVREVLDGVCDLLVAKNAQYGDSALSPIRIMSRAAPTEQLRVRIDDKLSRLAHGVGDQEDTVLDLIGYLVMLRIAQKREEE